MDTQVIELLGRNRLIDELLRAGLEVALPERDRGIDLIAYADLDARLRTFVARPIQMKASTGRHFSIYRKYEKFPDLILAFVWHLDDPKEIQTHALTYRESVRIGDAMGWTATASWKEKNDYSTQRPSQELLERLRVHRMTPDRWWHKITASINKI